MDNPDLTLTVQNMMAKMAAMQAELNSLKERAQALPQNNGSLTIPTTITSTRRKTLKRLDLALLGGAAAATAVGLPAVEAKVIANPQSNGLANRAGMLVGPPGAAAPINPTPSGSYTYGLIATGEAIPLDLTTLPHGNTGIYGYGKNFGVYSIGTFGAGVHGESTSGVGVDGMGATGVSGTGIGTGSIGVWGQGDTGVRGAAGVGGTGVYAQGGTGVNGIGAGDGSTGVSGSTVETNGTAVSGVATSTTSTGVFGKSPRYAGLFDGNVDVTGTINKSAVAFKIDHPTDPANKFLYHTCIESPDMMNLYNGLATLDAQGEATITMPDWFDALNSDFRYQLTSIGTASPNLHIAQEIEECNFKIAGGLAGQRVSWMITGIRQDAWAKSNRIPVEKEKTAEEKGKYLHPGLFGQPEERGVHWRPGPIGALIGKE